MEKKIAIIGCGSMGKMLLEKIINSKIIPEDNLFVANRTLEKIQVLKEKYKNMHICRTNKEAAENSDIIFICVRPSDIKTVLLEIIDVLDNSKHIISLNGSILFEQIETVCKNNKISKVIPSVTAEVNESQTLVCHNSKVTKEDEIVLNKILGTFGKVIELPENEMGMGAELVSCMPGFIAAIFNEIVVVAQEHTKIPEEQITNMLLNTMMGTSKLMLENKLSFEEVIIRVATKGGITEEGIKVIHEKLPEVVKEMFEKTLEKRKLTTENAIKAFNS